MFLNREFALAREIIQNYSTLDSGKFVNFNSNVWTPGKLFLQYGDMVIWIFKKILEHLIFPY